jgi:DNA (cytosine-5)-methyltransferase 1
MRYFSMFSGIGGFELGIQRAFGSNTDKSIRRQADGTRDSSGSSQQLPKLDMEGLACVGYSEIDKYAIKVYERNFSGHRNYGDATRIDPTDLPDFDLLVGGFPCQAFSIAGKRAGFDDTRGTLFFDIARILKEKQPRHMVLENVKGLLSHDSGRTFTTIIGVLTDLGYLVEWQVLNSKDFGVPQNRERVYIVGHLGNECGRKVFPITGNGGQIDELQRHIANTLTARYEGAQAVGTYIDESKRDAQETEPGGQSVLETRDESNDSNIRGGGDISPTC